MGLTRAEKHNRMLNKTFEAYNKQQESLPPCELYSRFLELAVEKLKINVEEARNKYGLFTVKQWEQVLNLGWNK
jgi:hypothetical protein